MNRKFECLFLDLDNTIYPNSCGIMQEIGNRMNRYMAERLGINPEDVNTERKALLEKFGTTLNALRRNYFIDPDEFLAFVHDIPLRNYLKSEQALDKMLGNIKLRKMVFTNADAQHARRVLNCLGIMRHFESIIDIHVLEFVNKPYRRAYRKALEIAAARPEECILVEDMTANIIPAKELGMTTVMVGNGAKPHHADYQIRNILELESMMSSWN
jgi:putative hydrolase of the HAD superfamily